MFAASDSSTKISWMMNREIDILNSTECVKVTRMHHMLCWFILIQNLEGFHEVTGCNLGVYLGFETQFFGLLKRLSQI